jgi:hypothetical protein
VARLSTIDAFWMKAEWVADDPDFGHHVREVAVESPGEVGQ